MYLQIDSNTVIALSEDRCVKRQLYLVLKTDIVHSENTHPPGERETTRTL